MWECICNYPYPFQGQSLTLVKYFESLNLTKNVFDENHGYHHQRDFVSPVVCLDSVVQITYCLDGMILGLLFLFFLWPNRQWKSLLCHFVHSLFTLFLTQILGEIDLHISAYIVIYLPPKRKWLPWHVFSDDALITMIQCGVNYSS